LPQEQNGPNMISQKQAVSTIGASGIQACSTCWKRAWDDIRGPFNHPRHSNRIRSDLLREQAAIYGQDLLLEFGFNYFFQQGQHMFVMPEQICAIFRKLDEFHRPHPTDTTRGKQLFQGKLLEDTPTVIIGIQPTPDYLDYNGIFLICPNANGVGNSWMLNITDGIADVDSEQDKMISLIEESEPLNHKQPKPKLFKPKHEPNIGESSEEAGSGGDAAG
jgi:hypothetical protein